AAAARAPSRGPRARRPRRAPRRSSAPVPPRPACSARPGGRARAASYLENIASARVPLYAALHPGVELIAQPVADQVDPKDQEQDGEPREERQPPAGRDVVAPLVEHRPPARCRGRDAEPEKA